MVHKYGFAVLILLVSYIFSNSAFAQDGEENKQCISLDDLVYMVNMNTVDEFDSIRNSDSLRGLSALR